MGSWKKKIGMVELENTCFSTHIVKLSSRLLGLVRGIYGFYKMVTLLLDLNWLVKKTAKQINMIKSLLALVLLMALAFVVSAEVYFYEPFDGKIIKCFKKCGCLLKVSHPFS